MDIFKSVLNFLIDNFTLIANSVLTLLPDSPFDMIVSTDNAIVQNMNYLFPIAGAVAHLEIYVSAVAIWYGIRVVARWIKVSSS